MSRAWFSDPMRQNFWDFSVFKYGAQNGPYLGPDFRRMSFQSEMPRVVEDDLRAGIIPTEGFRPGREKERVVLPPYRQRRRPMRAEELLKLGIKRDVAFVVTDEIELNLSAFEGDGCRFHGENRSEFFITRYCFCYQKREGVRTEYGLALSIAG